MMRAARERQGLHIAALAAAIKVAPRKLDALEKDRWHELPDATFVRALAQTVCRTLKIDARPVLERLPAAGTVALERASGVLNEPFRDRPGRDESSFAVAAIRPMVWAAAALMLAAVAVYFLPAGLWGGDKAPVALPAAPASAAAALAAASGAASAAALAASEAASASEGLVAVAAASVDTAASAAAPAVAARGSASAPVPALPPVRPPAVSPSPAPERAGETVLPSPPPTAASTAGIVQLRAGEASWVEVRDARGQLLLSRIVQRGESVGLNGQLPLRLTIGNAASTQVTFSGQPVELASRTRDNVARLELP